MYYGGCGNGECMSAQIADHEAAFNLREDVKTYLHSFFFIRIYFIRISRLKFAKF